VAIPASLTKVVGQLTPHYRAWIEASRFLILSTVGPEGTDASPRGDTGPVVRVIDESTLWLPDWKGNNRMDSLRNIVRDHRLSLMFLVPGSNIVVRVNGTAVVVFDEQATSQFEKQGKKPRSVVVISIREVYYQCAKALMRSNLWSVEEKSTPVPTAGQFRSEIEAGFDAASYDDDYAENAKDRMW
jgi:PPOX class probable FMN-dependent enzyme